MAQMQFRYSNRLDGVEVRCNDNPNFDAASYPRLPPLLRQLGEEGAVVEYAALALLPARTVFPDGLDRVLLPVEALATDAQPNPDQLILLRDGQIRTWVSREEGSEGEGLFRVPLRHQGPIAFEVVVVTWHESPAKQYDRLRPRRGQSSFGTANSGVIDQDCLDSNPFDFHNRLRTWNEDNYLREPNANELLSASSDWWDAGDWKGLLVLHGTALQSHIGLRHLSHKTVQSLCAKYKVGTRRHVIAMDHKTLDNSIGQNVRELLDRLPTNRKFVLDILAISRGALVARYLAEGHADAYMASRGQSVEVRRVVFVGGANDGSPSAGSPGHPIANLTVARCMACRKCFSADTPKTRCCDSIALAELGSAIGILFSQDGLQGQKDLREDSAMIQLINRRNGGGGKALPPKLTYHAIAGKYSCNQMNGCECNNNPIFDNKPNDLVVPFDSVCKPALGGDSAFKSSANRFPISGGRLLEVKKPHSELFKADKVSDQLLSWLDGGL